MSVHGSPLHIALVMVTVISVIASFGVIAHLVRYRDEDEA